MLQWQQWQPPASVPGGKRLYPTESVKYLYVKIDTWQHHVSDLSIKLNRANALLFKIRKYVSLKILRSIYSAFLTLTYLTAVLSGLRILAVFNEF